MSNEHDNFSFLATIINKFEVFENFKIVAVMILKTLIFSFKTKNFDEAINNIFFCKGFNNFEIGLSNFCL